MKEYFDISAFMNSKYVSADQNMLSRIRSLLIQAIKTQIVFPKIIAVVLDDDLIHFAGQEIEYLQTFLD